MGDAINGHRTSFLAAIKRTLSFCDRNWAPFQRPPIFYISPVPLLNAARRRCAVSLRAIIFHVPRARSRYFIGVHAAN